MIIIIPSEEEELLNHSDVIPTILKICTIHDFFFTKFLIYS